MSRARRREGGFSFVEILVVMGIISVLVGLGVVAYMVAFRKTPELQTTNRLQHLRGKAEAWYLKFQAYPPSDPTKIGMVSGTSFTVPKLHDLTNVGIESLYLCLQMPGWGQTADVADKELDNTDGDALEKPFAPGVALDLFEPIDAWGNPLVYFQSQDYAAADKTPPTYHLGEQAKETHVTPRPWRSEKTGQFEQARTFQLYSMGPDHLPNTEDDVKAWESK
jgi:type II secretory pathway pseudopilin PulG